MRFQSQNGPRQRRFGASTVEFAVLAPLLGLVFVWTLDFCRIFYHSLTAANCARNGAYYEAMKSAPITGTNQKNYNNTGAMYRNLEEAALADWPASVKPQPAVSSKKGQDADGEYIEVTVWYPFTSI